MGRAALVTVVALAACGLPDGEYFGDVPSLAGRDPHHLRWCNAGEPGSLDPAYAASTAELKIVHALFDGLHVYDLAGLPEPSLAETTEVSEDLRRYTFRLRAGARWTSDRAIDAYDFAYHAFRIVHPLTASPNADALVAIANAKRVTANTGRVVLVDTAGIAAGTVVEITGAGGTPNAELAKAGGVPETNARRSSRALALRDLGAEPGAAYATLAPGTPVRVIELSGRPASPLSPDGGAAWAYVHADGPRGEVYGWVPASELDVAPNAAVTYQVRAIGSDPAAAAIDVAGADLLLLPEVLGIRVPDPSTLVIDLEGPTPYFLHIATQRALRATPREAVSRSPRRWAEPGTIVGSGPLRLDAWHERDRLELSRSPTFWNQATTKLDRLTVISIADQAAATSYYFTGGCDATAANLIPTTYMPVMTGERRGGTPYRDFVIAPRLAIYGVVVNAKKFPDRHLRRALALAIDRRPVVQITKGGQIPTAQLTPGRRIAELSDAELALCGVTRDRAGVALIMETGTLCYVPPPGLDHDPDAARAELALARAALGPRFPATLTYRFPTGSEAHKLIGEYLQDTWQRELGITVTLEAQELKTLLADMRAGNYELARTGPTASFADTEAELLQGWRCGNPDNRAQWCNPAYDAALDAAAPVADRRARLVHVATAEQILIEDAVVIPLYVYTQQLLIRPYVRDLGVNPVDLAPIERAWLDPTWRP